MKVMSTLSKSKIDWDQFKGANVGLSDILKKNHSFLDKQVLYFRLSYHNPSCAFLPGCCYFQYAYLSSRSFPTPLPTQKFSSLLHPWLHRTSCSELISANTRRNWQCGQHLPPPESDEHVCGSVPCAFYLGQQEIRFSNNPSPIERGGV